MLIINEYCKLIQLYCSVPKLIFFYNKNSELFLTGLMIHYTTSDLLNRLHGDSNSLKTILNLNETADFATDDGRRLNTDWTSVCPYRPISITQQGYDQVRFSIILTFDMHKCRREGPKKLNYSMITGLRAKQHQVMTDSICLSHHQVKCQTV